MVHGGAADRGRGGDARMANLADVYDGDDVGRDATTKERFQLLEQRLDQLQETMLTQFVVLQVGRQSHHHPRKRALDVEIFDDEASNTFGNYPPRERGERRFIPNNCDSRWEARLKIDIPEFHVGLVVEDFLNWVNTV